jgi:large subunit ribosomal protein L22
VRLRGDKLKKLAESNGVGVDALAEAVERTGLEGERAKTAVRNWMADRDHPRCKASDIRRIAETLGCEPTEIVRFTSAVMHHRGGTRKARLVADLIRGRSAKDANEMLQFSPKRAAVNIRKCLLAAMQEAIDADADEGRLMVVESRVDEGPHIKRWRPKDRGRAHPILKRTSHITIGLEERG